ncbi:MAG TPA: gliding motility-associated ABC transporter substrate-binding protein GldG [Chitinophagaceae bacterium]|nr:gliding motility-associated ABC transporter substrate-binding protein GldG [Chitinophagaceae bacterium]
MLRNKKYNLLITTLGCIAAILLAQQWHYRADVTAEKRFTITAATENLIDSITEPIHIKVLLNGNLPADYKKLAIATTDLLEEFSARSNRKITVSYETPGEGLNDTTKYQLFDSLQRMGVVFERSSEIVANDNKNTEQLITPSAIVSDANGKAITVDLRSSKKVFKQYNILTDIPEEDKEATRNAAEALLEFKFANAIDKLTRKRVPTIAYVVGNGQPIDLTVNDLGESLRNDYRLAIFDLKKGYPQANQIDALLIVKPTQPFTDEDKLKLDQYVMNGGNIIWCVDKVYAELDSLMRSQADFVAFDRNLNIDDLLFKQGVRINNDLVQDLNCSKIPLIIGYNPDNSPRMQRIPWPYYPFVSGLGNNAITKNLDRVLPIFPGSIDTVKAPNIQKTILLATDTNSKRVASPALVTLNNIRSENDFLQFNKSYVPIAVLCEGNFSSLYANRISAALKDSVQAATGLPFTVRANQPSKQIFIADADVVTNVVTKTDGPLEMGMLPFEAYRFANREFLLNCVDYLVSERPLYEARNKELQLRLLDKEKLNNNSSFWQLINTLIPILLVLLFGVSFNSLRKRKYATTQ